MEFRFTLSNDIEGDLVISEPGGWDTAKFKLERNKDYHSLVEFYDQPLTFYGDDISHDGGISYIRNIEQTQGIDAQIGLLIELNETGIWETAFQGILSIETAKEIDFYKLEMGVLRNDFWQKFMNRKGIPIDLSASVDLDGNARTPISPITLRLPSQAIRSYYQAILDQTAGYPGLDGILISGSDTYVQFDWNIVTLDEIEKKFSLSVDSNPGFPVNILKVKYGGEYTFTLTIDVRDDGLPGFVDPKTYLEIYFKINSDTSIAFTKTDIPHSFGAPKVRYTYSDQHTLLEGDEITIYGQRSTTDAFYVYYQFEQQTPEVIQFYNNIDIVADTIFQDTETDAFIIKDAAESIVSKAIGQDNVVTSDYLDSCAGLYAIMKGLHVRGYSLADKQFSLSFDDWWKGVEPILNLGLGYENTSPETIRIEQKSYFYDKTTSINFDFVNNIERSYDLDSVFKLIEIGYNKWSAESESGIDDPQTKRWYNTRFKTVGKEIKVLSQFIAASLAIEQTRRNRVEEGKDWRLDDDVMIIALKETSPYEPELSENFSDVTGLLNYETRYNIRLSVARNFERWKDYFNGCLQWYLSDDYKFSNGEGNYDMSSTLFADDCEAEGTSPESALSEKQDIEVTSDYLFKPIKYSFVHPMTWDEYQTIRDNPTKAIGISRTDSDHTACFIDILEYEITRGRATFEVYLADNDYL